MDGYVAPLDAIVELAERYARWSWSTTRTPWALWGRPAQGRLSCSVSRIASIL